MTSVSARLRVLPAVVAMLLLACAALLIAGGSIEKSTESGTHAAPETSVVETPGHNERAEHSAEGAVPEQTGEGGPGESVLGVPLESPAALAAMAVVSVALALLGRPPIRVVTGAVVMFAVAAGVLDVAEVVRQVAADRTGLAALAALIALLRAAILVGAALLWRAARSRPTTSGVASGT